ncbi:16S rRNA (uracil(1498)-N(3))-methyltransferase [Rhodoblastus acidophilus]|uniref:Ribosomal RNA small subunit methyltransferase E n=1 Tax=Candidatus Rhodoblastus alkanivorans TaxID=2954117 RepID=A0ABS9ZAW1_9HYPH|nr:16S rRNA (uracil(1498)-N(3))-methyltransferase [Candidatus Rhodoblastus alkanivorans]MCI4677785.1 16S rRNA (uracil(1498)-N(3))-methyltransferase [Candidatus Rhodoblastus alkanivorans]MCI4684717.1 16S rRNA (uracil(1498)-N(3))-methyltransferase [Candidatus Rhodoblastus alkanivorans]MDI4642039.1 16S rRNA (uracil(1498)-N(3))-methyltransferase [Rhodoblastus acidophilus]
MSRLDFTTQRLWLAAPLAAAALVELTREQANYLVNVLRLGEGAQLLVFNGRDGEWRATLAPQGRKGAVLRIEAQSRPQEGLPDLDYLFAPLKHARLDYMAQKAVEMGARRLRPVLTRRTQASRVNLDRMRANVVEAAEQCGLLALAEVLEPESLEAALGNWPQDRLLIFCDEAAEIADPLDALREAGADFAKFAVLIGPEGGFDESERARLARIAPVARISLGPRVLRADTAAVAALALVQAVLGDWRG